MNVERGRAVMSALKKIADADSSRDINELRIIVALERAIARIEAHPILFKHLVFKGGFVLFKLIDSPRFTRDVDALAHELSAQKIPALMESALSKNLDDGLWYGDLKNEPLEHQGDYEGIRFSVAFQIGEEPSASKVKKLSRIQMDIGFGDALPAKPKSQTMESILGRGQSVSWRVYPLESMFAEKLQTLYRRGSANSRSRDVYDLVLLFARCQDRTSLLNAIRMTFERRNTEVPRYFLSEAKRFDLSILRGAWPSVELGEDPPSFDDQWKALLEILAELDRS